MRLLSLCLALACVLADAQATAPLERRAILDATRPLGANRAGQAVRIKVDRLNVDGGYAVLVGSLVGPPGKEINWQLANDCHPDLDKMLWVVLRKQGGRWGIVEMEICASEPPYWYLEQYGGLVWPCGVYAGLGFGAERENNLEVACRRQRKGRPARNQ